MQLITKGKEDICFRSDFEDFLSLPKPFNVNKTHIQKRFVLYNCDSSTSREYFLYQLKYFVQSIILCFVLSTVFNHLFDYLAYHHHLLNIIKNKLYFQKYQTIILSLTLSIFDCFEISDINRSKQRKKLWKSFCMNISVQLISRFILKKFFFNYFYENIAGHQIVLFMMPHHHKTPLSPFRYQYLRLCWPLWQFSWRELSWFQFVYSVFESI